jgi:hypothetical protein
MSTELLGISFFLSFILFLSFWSIKGEHDIRNTISTTLDKRLEEDDQ